MTRMTEEENGRWIAALVRRIRYRLAAAVLRGRSTATPAPPRREPPSAKGDQ